MVSRTLRGRVGAPLLALAVSASAGFVGSLVTRHATASESILPAPSSPPTWAQLAASSPVSGWVQSVNGDLISLHTVGGMDLTAVMTPGTRYYVHPSPVLAQSGVVTPGAFVVVDGHLEIVHDSVVAVNITVIPNFRGARPGFEGHRDGLVP